MAEGADLSANNLFVLHQKWKREAAFFLKGTTTAKPEYNQVITDYSDVENLSSGYDANLVKECSHLNPQNLEGLTIDKSFTWTPGVPITFPRDRLHVSSNFLRAGIKKKLGLSIFTSSPDL